MSKLTVNVDQRLNEWSPESNCLLIKIDASLNKGIARVGDVWYFSESREHAWSRMRQCSEHLGTEFRSSTQAELQACLHVVKRLVNELCERFGKVSRPELSLDCSGLPLLS